MCTFLSEFDHFNQSLVAVPLLLPTPTAINIQSKSKTASPTLRSLACAGNQQQLKINLGFSSVTLVGPRSSDCEPVIPNQSEFDQLLSNHGNHGQSDRTRPTKPRNLAGDHYHMMMTGVQNKVLSTMTQYL